jgi:hypothetical protein
VALAYQPRLGLIGPSRLSTSAFRLRPAEVCDFGSSPYFSEYDTYGEEGHAASASASAGRTSV